MSTTNSQKCPLCCSDAKYEIFHSPYCKHFTCPSCVEFCIDEQAEDFMKNTTEEIRRNSSLQARATVKGRMYIMRAPTEVETKAQTHPKLTMIAETIFIDA